MIISEQNLQFVVFCGVQPRSLIDRYQYFSHCIALNFRVEGERYSNPIIALDRPRGFQEVEAPRFQDSRHIKVVRLSALCTGRLYPPKSIPGTHFCQRLSQYQGHSAAGRIVSMENESRWRQHFHPTCWYLSITLCNIISRTEQCYYMYISLQGCV